MNRISSKTWIFAFIVIVFTLLLFDIYIWNHTKSFLFEEVRKDFQKKASLAKALLEDHNSENPDSVSLYRFSLKIKELTSYRTTLIDKDGRVLADSDVLPAELSTVENHLSRPEVQDAMRIGSGLNRRKSSTIQEKLFYYCEPLWENGRITGFIRLAMFSPEYGERTNFLIGLIIHSNIFFLTISIIGTLLYIRMIKSQIDALRNPLFQQRDQTNFQKLSRQKYEEFDRVANEINLLGEKLQTFYGELEDRKEQLLSIFNSLDEGVAAFKREGIVLIYNNRFKEILGVSDENFNNIRFYDWIQFPPIIQGIEEFLESGQSIKKRTKFYGERFIDYQILPLMYNKTPLSGFLLTLADVTHLQQLETIRQDFVANVGHEFKTPLTSIRGYAETLLTDGNKKKQRDKFLKKIEKQTIRLENLVIDLLQLSRIERKETQDLVKMNPIPVIKKVLSEYTTLAAEKDLTLHREIPKLEKKIKIKANEQVLQIILGNLLSNAIQYHRPQGEIWFRLQVIGNQLRLEVEDNGIGISEDQLERIFERFYRIDTARYLFPEGSGLGLSIVKHSVELLSGKIGVKSKVEQGSLFWLEIPLR
jgi:two-component system phosphate regulon sensor histidine kinase PhoR